MALKLGAGYGQGWLWDTGDSGGKSKAAQGRRQEDIARQGEETQSILQSFLSQLVPGSEEYNQLVAEGGRYVQNVASPDNEQELVRNLGQQLVAAQQARVAGGGPATALESRTDLATKGLRDLSAFTPEEQSIFSALRGLPQEGQQAASGGIFSDLVSRAQNPDQYYQSTLAPALALAEEQNRAGFAGRGLLRSGLEQEGAARVGNELAIQEAAGKNAFRQQSLGNFQDLFNAGQGLRNRQIGLEGDLVNLQLGRESNLTGLLNSNTFNRGTQSADLLQRQTGRSQDLADQAAQDEATQNAQVGRLIGTGAGAALGSFAGPGGALAGAQLGNSLFGGSSTPNLLASQRATTPSNSNQPLNLGQGLSLQSGNMDSQALQELLKAFNGMK